MLPDHFVFYFYTAAKYWNVREMILWVPWVFWHLIVYNQMENKDNKIL